MTILFYRPVVQMPEMFVMVVDVFWSVKAFMVVIVELDIRVPIAKPVE